MTTATRPAPGPPREYRFPRFEQHRLANGVRVLVAPVSRVPLVTLQLVVNAGAAREDVGRAGVAQLTAKALAEGTATLTADELTERFERLGGALEPEADWDSTELQTTVMTHRLDEALALIAEVLATPRLAEEDVLRLRSERLAELLQRQAEPRGLGNDAFARALYPAELRYSLPVGGSSATVSQLTADHVRAFHAEAITPGGTTVIVVGDVSADGAVSAVDRALGSWRSAGGGRPVAAAIPGAGSVGTGTPRVHLVAKDDAVQSELRIGHPGPPRLHPDYFPLVIMNAILGGLFNSRINLNLREAHGYTYGAFSAFDWRRDGSVFGASSAVRSDATVSSVREVFAEIARMRDQPVSDDELSLAKQYLDGVFPIRFETTEAIASALASWAVYGLPERYFDTYREQIRAVTVADVQRVARDHLRPDELRTVVVGDPAVVRPPLEEWSGCDVAVYDVSGERTA